MKYRWLLLLLLSLSPSLTAAEEQHSLFTALLKDHVSNGNVKYAALCKDARLEQYLAQLAATNPASTGSRSAQLAFWINAYNAYTLQAICTKYPVKSINELHTGGLIVGSVLNTTIWDRDFVVIDNKKMSLNHIEHEIVRKEFGDPRGHFALVCASKSCPALRNEAFEAGRLEEQLQNQGEQFFADPYRNLFNLEKREARLSKILDWYSKDFGKNQPEILLYVSQFLPDPLAISIRENPRSWRIKHLDYDWSLNE